MQRIEGSQNAGGTMAMTAVRGIVTAVRARYAVFLAVAAGVLALDVLLPVIVLSLARKPVDFFTFNPWLKRLPDYLGAPAPPLADKLGRLWDIALFWFSADGSFGVEWGFAVTVSDLARFGVMALIVAAYFALWAHLRHAPSLPPLARRAGGGGGVVGAVSSVLGLSTSACTVMGCGAPVIPVLGLAFVGLSSTTLQWMSALSAVGTGVVLAGLLLGVGCLGWRVGARSVTA